MRRPSFGGKTYINICSRFTVTAQDIVIFSSQHYARKLWTKHELRQAQARAFTENSEYNLPLRIDDTTIPGVNHTVGDIDLRQHSIVEVADWLCRKIWGDDGALDRIGWKGDMVTHNGVEVASFGLRA
jgi:hypothetical protein